MRLYDWGPDEQQDAAPTRGDRGRADPFRPSCTPPRRNTKRRERQMSTGAFAKEREGARAEQLDIFQAMLVSGAKNPGAQIVGECGRGSGDAQGIALWEHWDAAASAVNVIVCLGNTRLSRSRLAYQAGLCVFTHLRFLVEELYVPHSISNSRRMRED